MDNITQLNTQIMQSLKGVIGIQDVCFLRPEDHHKILNVEEEAEKRSLKGLGKVINSGVREVLQFDLVYVALTTMEFTWGHCATLILMKGDKLVGEEIHDEAVMAKLSEDPNVWFMHKNFVIYKDRVSFPKDIMKKNCHFEIPSLSADWLSVDTENGMRFDVKYGNPSTFCDVYLKEHYFDGTEQLGLGTILIGVNTIFVNN